jgi:hypothetical protein
MTSGSWSGLFCRRHDSERTDEAARQPQSSLLRRYLVDSPDRRGLAIFTRRVSFGFHLLAASQAVRRRRRVAEGVARIAGRVGLRGIVEWDEAFLDGSFASTKKGALPSGKPNGARARSGWYWSTVKAFRWEFGWKVPPRVKLSLRKPRWRKSESRKRKATRAKSRSGDCRSRLRFRSPAPTTAPPRYRTDRPLSRDQPPAAVRRRAQAAAVQAPLDRGADQCLAGQFRRLLVRHEHLLCTYRAFFYLACFWITLRRCF